MSATHESRPSAGTDAHAAADIWLARLMADDCTPTERAVFEHWLTASPENEDAYREAERLWHRSGGLHRFADIQAAMDEPAARPVSRLRRWRLPLAAAATVVLAVSVVLSRPWIHTPAGDRLITATGEQRTVELADGSQVLLDAETELRIAYSEHERRLVLGKGRAQFKVQHDLLRPFIVQAANGAVTAHGTEFQVRVDDRDVTVTLLEGKVSVDVDRLLAPAKTETLVPGEQIRFDGRHVLPKKRADLEVAQSWTYGDLVFKEWRLQQLVAEMNRYSKTKIRIEDASIDDLLISGRFHAGDYRTMIRVLESDWPVRADTVSGTEIALYRR